MKVLLAISSWPISAENGDHQSSRDTWLTRSEGLDYRFFMGDGTPANENEELIEKKWITRPGHYAGKLGVSEITAYQPKEDEVLFPVPYDFKHLPFKVREIFRWAKTRDYDYIFKVDTDTYVDVPRLLTSGFQNHDYTGTPFSKRILDLLPVEPDIGSVEKDTNLCVMLLLPYRGMTFGLVKN